MNPSAASLLPTPTIDSTHALVVDFTARHAGSGDDRERAVNLYYAVRDDIRYDQGTWHFDHCNRRATNAHFYVCGDADRRGLRRSIYVDIYIPHIRTGFRRGKWWRFDRDCR